MTYISVLWRALFLLAGAGVAFSFFGGGGTVAYEKPSQKKDALIPSDDVRHLPTPDPLKAIYMTQCVVGTKAFREKLVKLIDETEINALVIDVKDYSGRMAFKAEDPFLRESLSDSCRADDMKDFLKYLHEKNIYTIARITVFQDPYLAKKKPQWGVTKKSATSTLWADRKGINFLDPGNRGVWEYVAKMGKESYAIGFDEINFDYIRFPSDGNMSDIYFPASNGRQKREVIKEFWRYLSREFREGEKKIPISADLFGMTTTAEDDLNIGQLFEYALPYFDYVVPMVYPSHYPPNFNGWKNPNAHVYDVVYFTMNAAVRRAEATTTKIALSGSSAIASTTPPLYSKPSFTSKKLRTWIQDFDYGGNYGSKEVRDQIQASSDAGVTSYMIWAPSNIYTREALLPISTSH